MLAKFPRSITEGWVEPLTLKLKEGAPPDVVEEHEKFLEKKAKAEKEGWII